nr:farnesyl diphosphate synthase [Motiliproteus sp. SC1-56]
MSLQVAPWRQRVDAHLEALVARSEAAPRLQAALRYSLFNGGKRLRPILVYATNQALGGNSEAADAAACAVECIHAYSLVHDDLPAMDDDDLRRGQPTCHIAFDEATAVLAGDALQALAFEALSDPRDELPSTTQLAMVRTLARASGDKGMVAGQVVDTQAAGGPMTLEALETMHALKTGALIRASVTLGALSAGADTAALKALERYAEAIGLAFQVQDDILDIESDTQTLGKRQGADIARDKPTYPALLGLEEAKAKARKLQATAIEALAPFNDRAGLLRAIAAYIIERDH